MDIRNCKNCNKIYNYDGHKICIDCRRKEEEEFQLVKNYLKENPGSKFAEVVEETGVSTEKIMKFLREDRLELKGNDGFILACESCGDMIPSGRFCHKCINKLEGEIDEVIRSPKVEKPKRSEREKFRVADKYRNK